MKNVQDFFSDENKASQKGNPYFNPEKVGDYCRGYFLKQRKQVNQMKDAREDGRKVYNMIYTVIVPEGEEYAAVSGGESVTVKAGELLDIYGKMIIEDGDELLQIVSGFGNLQPGVMIGVQLTELRPPKKKGHHPTKIISGFIDAKDVNTDVVKQARMGAMVSPETGATMSEEETEEKPF